MKFVASALACFVASATTMPNNVNGELRGVATRTRNLEFGKKVAELAAEPRRVPPGIIVNNGGDTDTDEPEKKPESGVETPDDMPDAEDCTSVGTAPYKTEEYVVVQYNSTTNAADSIDFENTKDTSALDTFYRSAYNIAAADLCTQQGASNEMYEVEFLAYDDDDQNTFLLRVGRLTNAISTMFNNDDNCGPIVYKGTDSSSVDFSTTTSGEDDQCDCTPPSTTDVVSQYNAALVGEFKDDDLAEFIIGTEQLCADPDCEPAKDGKTTYSSNGVCLSELSHVPSGTPSEFPTSTDEPTDAPTGTDAPTESKASEAPTTSPSKTTGPSTTAPSPAPSTDTIAPSVVVSSPAPSVKTSPAPSGAAGTPAPTPGTTTLDPVVATGTPAPTSPGTATLDPVVLTTSAPITTTVSPIAPTTTTTTVPVTLDTAMPVAPVAADTSAPIAPVAAPDAAPVAALEPEPEPEPASE